MRKKMKNNKSTKDILRKKTKINYYRNKMNDRCTLFKELIRYYIELENRLKSLEEIFSKNDSENNQNFLDGIYPKPSNEITALTKLMFTILMAFGL